MKDRFDRSLRLGYGFSLSILFLVGAVSYLTLTSLLQSNRVVTHSGEVIEKLEKLMSVMKDAETGQRGYLLSGKANFLDPYHGAYAEAQTLNNQLLRLTADNPLQRNNMSAIGKVLHQRLEFLQQLIDKKQQGGVISAGDLDTGKAAMDALRLAVVKAEYDEQLLLRSGTASLNTYTELAPAFILAGLVIAFLITLYSYRKVTADIREKERLRADIEQRGEETRALNEELTAANEEVTRTNQFLEQRVSERTQALQTSEEKTQALNEELTAMNEELIATNEELSESEHQLREAFAELRAGEERSAKLAAIVASSDDAIIGKDLDGIITAWNRGATQIFGYTEAEMVGQSVLKLIPDDLQHEEPVILSRLRKGEKIDRYETLRRTADGRLIDVSLTISPIHDKAGRVIGVSKIARDITDKKRDEQRKNDFIGMASHELKTPLTSLMGLVQVLQQKLQDAEDKFIPAALAKVAYQGRKMTGLINGFLNISRLESGKLFIAIEHFNVNDLIRETIEDTRMTAASHTIVFEPAGDITVQADRDKIGSVISNLLSNAIKYSPKNSVITVRSVAGDTEVWVSVQDQGIGVSAQDQDKLFDRYYRVQNVNTKHISGFGVGLYLTAEIIGHHGGRIWVESEQGAGSTFTFSLPLTV